jgi:hypothetical protein
MTTVVAVLFGLSLLVASAPPAATEPQMHGHAVRAAAQTARTVDAADPCADNAYGLFGPRWETTLKWYFAASSTPSGLSRTGVRDVIKRAFANVTGARNDCGRGDNVSATALYKGTTSRRAKCNGRDGYNVVGFRSLSADVLAYACYWYVGGRMVEADIQINNTVSWALGVAGCVNKQVLEATMTHEAGHVFGLDHVPEAGHARLTMSPLLNGLCNNEESSLGLGDLLGLEALY